MSLKNELCKYFQRGSCRYGQNCKYLHSNQQQQKPNVFGSQTGAQQQKPNPFGFGVQNNGPAAGGLKPFENKWVRPGQPANQSQGAQSQGSANHDCTDPAVCKRLITEDFQNERPLWKLTCYGHFKHLPCDISGDISCEELRAEAYSDAKRGLGIQAIVEREKNLEKSKLSDYENLLRNGRTTHTQSALSNHSPFPTVGTTPPSLTPQNTGASPFSSFGPQQGSSPNMLFGVRPSTPLNNAFAPFQGSGPFGSTNAPSGPFGTQAPAQTGGNPFAVQTSGSSFPAQTSGNSFAVQTSGNSFASNMAGFGNGGMNSQGNQAPFQASGNAFASNMTPSLPVTQQQIQTPAFSQPSVSLNGFTNSVSVEQRPMVQKETLPADASIWTKAEWKLGEIPEQAPPPEYVR
ncbi:hypothetical protein RND81_10G180200 [Saponaria officinalis]|uniref:C3H1-type domain-containing protein n=1 Tax=Saponaria officinalis TaxID=3572 RepID=A0AAW1I334_SAPOF